MSAQPETVTAAQIVPLEMPVPDAPAAAVATPPAPAAGSSPTPDAAAELDASGTPFDPSKHLRKKHPHSGRWMPKGGRKPKTAAPTNGVQTSFIPDEPQPAPAADTSKTPEKSEPAADAPKAATEPAAETRRDCSAEAAECATSAAEFAAGMLFDDPECAHVGKHRENLVRSAQAFIQSKGWQFTAGAALFVVLLAWVLRIAQRPKPREKIRGWLSPRGPEETARNVTPAPSASKPAAESPRPSAPNRSPIIEVPAHIPPLAH